MNNILNTFHANLITVNERELCFFDPLDTDLRHNIDAFFILNHLSVITVSGQDAESFLQGQLSIDVSKELDGDLGAYCNKEGRIISVFKCIKGSGRFTLVMPQDLINFTIKKLKRYAMFSKVSIEENNQSVLAIKTNGKTTLLTLPPEDALIMCEGLKKERPMLGSLDWHYQNITHHIPSIYPSTQEYWLPHKIGLHQLDALNFEKGCYLGQEIIARMHFKAKLKHSVISLTLDINKKIKDPLYFDNQNIGIIIDSCPSKNNETRILASVLNNTIDDIKNCPEKLS